MKKVQRVFLIAASAVFLAAQANAIMYFARPYDPNLQRWLTRDPLGDDGSMVFTITKIEPRLESPSVAEKAMMVQQFEDPLAAFTQVNLNPSLFVANNPIGNVDPRGLDWLNCMANCVQKKDPLNNAGKVCLSALGGTFPNLGGLREAEWAVEEVRLQLFPAGLA